MASPVNFPNGLNLAGTVFANGPATLQLAGPAYLSTGVQWLDTISGDNANAGTLPELPVQTLAQAVTNSVANSTTKIVIGAGSSESLATSQALATAGLSIYGCGTGSNRPRYTCTGAGGTGNMLDVTAAGIWIEGIYFPATTVVGNGRIVATAANMTVKDCYFECGAVDTVRSVRVHTGANSARIEGCSFVTTASRPAVGLEVSAVVTDPVIVDCVFDGGSYGWSDYALKVSAAATRIRVVSPTFINRSDFGITTTGTTYEIFGLDMGGTGNVRIDA